MISLPLDRAVYQRNSNNSAIVKFATQLNYVSNMQTGTAKYYVEKLDKYGNNPSPGTYHIGPTVISDASLIQNNGLFNTDLTLATGWYKITVTVNVFYRPNQTTPMTESVKVGVGEVLFFAGQSNAQGISGVRSPDTGTEYDCVSAINNTDDCYCKSNFGFPVFDILKRGTFDGERKIAPNGTADVWYYEALGKKIVDKEAGKVIPVAFFNVGYGGSAINNWQRAANNPTSIIEHPFFGTSCSFAGQEPEGQPYKSLKTSLNYYGGMLGARSVVWHQGESDALPDIIANTHGGAANTRSYYNTALSQVIAKTRQDFNGNLGWAISRASRIYIKPDASSSVRPSQLYINNNVKLGQEDAKNGNSNTQWGAYFSDDITDRIDTQDNPDRTHFNDVGLGKMAEMYSSTGAYAGNSNGGNILGFTPIQSPISPPIQANLSNDGNNVTLSVQGNYPNHSWCWVKNDGKMNDCQGTSQSITIPNDGDINNVFLYWRCYITRPTGQTTISQEISVPISSISLKEKMNVVGVPSTPGTNTGSFKVKANQMDWQIANVPSWASVNTSSGSDGETTILVSFQANNSSAPRNATINVSGANGYGLQTVDISQQGTGGGTPSCNNGPIFSITSASYDNTTKCVSYQFNASNLSNATWSISGTSYSGSLPQPITSNTGTVNCGVTLPNGNYNFVLTGVSCTGTALGAFTVSGGGTGGGTTIDRTEGGIASDDGASNPSYEAEVHTFDNQSNTKWLVFNPTGNIAYDFSGSDAYAINSYTVTSANDEPARDPKNWNLQGSNDGSNWTTVDTQSNQFFGNRFETKTYNFTNSTPYQQYRLNVTANNGSNLLQIAEIQMFGPSGTGTPPPPPPPSGGCSFTDGQFLLNWYDETIQAKFCNGVLYARATWGAWKHPNWLIGAGMNPTTAACFANYNPGCGALRVAAEEPTEELSEKTIAYPNPTTGKIKIAFSLQKAENVWLNLYDTQGKSLDLRDFEGKVGRNEVEYDLQNYPSGAYFVNFQSSEKREILKVMKVN
jgi:hypothetical protein